MKYVYFVLIAIAVAVLVSYYPQALAQTVRVFTSAQVGTNPVDGYCLTTNGATSTWAPCGASGGSKWTDTGSFINPTNGESIYVTGSSTLIELVTNTIRASSSAGLIFRSNNGTQVADFGAGGGSNATFNGGLNVDGTTRLATSLTGILRADSGSVATQATGTLTETVSGLQFDTTRDLIGGSAVLSLSSGFTIPLTASTTEWATAYASTTNLTPAYIRSLFSASSPITYNSGTGAFTFSTAGDWSGTFDSLEGSAYLNRANHTGTQTASTISDFTSTARGVFSETVTGLTYTSGTGVLSLDGTYIIPLIASTTNWNTFYDTPSNRITANDGLTWSGNNLNFDGGNAPGGELGGTWASPTLDDGVAVSNWNLTSPTLTTFFGTPCTGNQFLQDISDTGAFTCVEAAGGGGGGALSTTTDTIGAGGPQLVSYVTGDVMFGGSSSTTAEFQLDDDGAQFIISSSSANATSTIESNNNAQAVRLGDDSGVGVEWFFGTVGDAIMRGYGTVTEFIVAFAETLFQGNVRITGDLHVATTTYYAATTSDVLIVDGHLNTGEWVEEYCTSPAAETTQVAADTLRGCNRYSYLEDANGVIDFVSPATATSSYFRVRAGAAGTATAAGDGMALGWATGMRSANFHRMVPAMEWTMRQDYAGTANNATSSLIFAGITDKVSISVDTATEPAEGFYVISTTTTANYVFACNPGTGATTYINTGIASSTSVTAGANPFVHFRLEIAPSSTSTNHIAILKARTETNQNLVQVAACAVNNGTSNTLLAPIIAIGKASAGTSMEVHSHFLKFWYRNFVF